MTAWQQWEDELDDRDRSASSSAPAADPRNERVRVGRRTRRRERRQAARYGQRAARRRYLGDAEATPGVAVLIGALLVVGVVVWLRLGSDGKGPTTNAQQASDTAVTAAGSGPAVPPTSLDPHAGAEVLPPRAFPPAPPKATAPAAGADPLATATGFASQACARRSGESEQEFRDRLAPYSTSAAADAWQHGSAERIHCMQLDGGVLSADASTAKVTVTAVQVYPDATDPEGMRAYRWAATVSLVLDGQSWKVAG